MMCNKTNNFNENNYFSMYQLNNIKTSIVTFFSESSCLNPLSL